MKDMSCIYKVFSETTSPNFVKKNDYANKYFLLCVEKWANHKLVREGYLTLNDLLLWLGYDEDERYCMLGWDITKEHSYDSVNIDVYPFPELGEGALVLVFNCKVVDYL